MVLLIYNASRNMLKYAIIIKKFILAIYISDVQSVVQLDDPAVHRFITKNI